MRRPFARPPLRRRPRSTHGHPHGPYTQRRSPDPVEAAVASLRVVDWVVVDEAFGTEVCEPARQEAELLYRAGALTPAGVGRGGERVVDRSLRGDLTLWLLPENTPPALASVRRRLIGLLRVANRELLMNVHEVEMQLTRYDAGARYDKHVDAFRGEGNRLLTFVYYLNPQWKASDGGELRVHSAEGPVDVAPLMDRLVVFPSEEVEHEVLAAHAPRYAISGWFRPRPKLAVLPPLL